MDTQNTNKLNFKISSNIIILLVPALALLFLYSYEMGFADYFGIPFSLVSMKPTEFYPYIIWNILLIVFLSVLVLSVAPFYNFYYSEKMTISRWWRLVIIFFIRFAILFIVCKMQYDMTGLKMLFNLNLCALFILIASFSILDYLFMHARESSQQSSENIIHVFFNKENSYTYFVLVLFVQLIIYLTIIYTSFGYSNAKSKSIFLSFNKNNETYLVIAVYDDCCIIKSKSDVEQRNNVHFIKMNKEGLNDQKLEWVTIEVNKSK